MEIWYPQVGATNEGYTNGVVKNVYNSFSNEVVGKVAMADSAALNRALDAAVASKPAMASLSVAERIHGLTAIANQLEAEREVFATRLSLEAAKPYIYATAEVDRAIQCFRLAAMYCASAEGTHMQLDLTPSGYGKEGWIKRFPVGVISGIAPFNFPLNLAVHKIAPALAAGCPIVLKPASSTPLSALALGRLVRSLNVFPEGSLSIVPCDRETGEMLVTDSRSAMLSFTGSDAVGWQLKARAGKKRVALELGGNAAVLICETANVQEFLSHAEAACFGYQGQVCIHAQRIRVHKSRYKEVLEGLEDIARQLVPESPNLPSCKFSAMIDEQQAARVYDWAKAAVSQGANPVVMHPPEGAILTPILLTNTAPSMNVNAEEVFGPLITVEAVDSFEEGIAGINASRFGLQAAVYTSLIREMDTAFQQIECGGVILNGPPSFRVDHMPYGGEKDSGLGREGIRYAMEEMTYPKLLVKSFR